MPREPAPTRHAVFIGGTSYSGSTLLNLLLASGPRGFAIGEAFALFRPETPHHRQPRCGCGDPGCALWPEVREAGAEALFAEVFRRFPEVSHAVESSKSLEWIAARAAPLAGAGVRVHHVLVWKRPLEYAWSMHKRGRSGWAASWLGYHRRYLARFPTALPVRYADLVASPAEALSRLGAPLGLEAFPGQERFWEDTHHLLFGNAGARMHLYAPGSSLAAEQREKREREGALEPDEPHGTPGIYRLEQPAHGLPPEALAEAGSGRELTLLEALLASVALGRPLDPRAVARALRRLRGGAVRRGLRAAARRLGRP